MHPLSQQARSRLKCLIDAFEEPEKRVDTLKGKRDRTGFDIGRISEDQIAGVQQRWIRKRGESEGEENNGRVHRS